MGLVLGFWVFRNVIDVWWSDLLFREGERSWYCVGYLFYIWVLWWCMGNWFWVWCNGLFEWCKFVVGGVFMGYGGIGGMVVVWWNIFLGYFL